MIADRLFFANIAVVLFFLVSGCHLKADVIGADWPRRAQAEVAPEQGSSEPQPDNAIIMVGDKLPPTTLVDAFSLRKVELLQLKGKILLLSVVPTLDVTAHLNGKILFSSRMPSLDTTVFEPQTVSVAVDGKRLPKDVERIIISSDSPYTQKRFAQDSGLAGLWYLSDYRTGSFGRSTGLLVKGKAKLTRSVVVVDREGIVRHIEAVSDQNRLPDIEKACSVAARLADKDVSGHGK